MALKFGTLRDYNPRSLSTYSERELRAEYQRLQSISRKRLERLERAGYTETDLYTRFGQGWQKVSEIPRGHPELLAKSLHELAWFSQNERSTVRGEKAARNREIDTLHQHGYDFVNRDNYDRFRRFMQTMRERGMVKAYGSDRVAEIFAEVEAKDPEEQILIAQELFEEYF